MKRFTPLLLALVSLFCLTLPANAQYTRFKTGGFPGFAGLSTVGYRLIPSGGAAGTRTAGASETFTGSCSYGATVSFPAGFTGSILWDTGAGTNPTLYASEVINPGGAEYLDAPVSRDPFTLTFSPVAPYANTMWGSYFRPGATGTDEISNIFNTTVAPGTSFKLAAALSTVGACTYTLGTLDTVNHVQPVYYYAPGVSKAAATAGSAPVISTANIYYQSDNKTIITVVRTPGTF